VRARREYIACSRARALVQGYLLGRPLPVEEAQRLIGQDAAMPAGSRSVLLADRR
jgi:hypothetical protein